MRREYNAAVGEDLIAMHPGFHVRGIRVFNPTASWLRIDPHLLYVPPFTMDWSAPLPGAAAIDVKWSDSPSGTPSGDNATGVAQVVLTDEILAHSPGMQTGTVAEQSQVTAEMSWAGDAVIAKETGSFSTNIVPATTVRKPIVQIHVFAWQATDADADNLRGMATIWLLSTNIGIITFTISPEQPMVIWVPPPGAIYMPANTGLNAQGFSHAGCGNQKVGVSCLFYGSIPPAYSVDV